MVALIPDVDELSVGDLRKLGLRFLEETAVLKAESAALREEIARLKGLKGRPRIRPTGMERAADPKPTQLSVSEIAVNWA